MNCLPKSAQPGARTALAEMYHAEGREHALRAVKVFAADYDAKWPKAVAEITRTHRRVARVLRLPGRVLDPPADHEPDRVDLRDRAAASARHEGPGSRAAGIAMAFKLLESAHTRWRAVNAPHLVALVRAGAHFEKGKLVERPDGSGGEQLVA